MDRTVIKVIGLTNGEPTAFDGQWVVEYDPGRDGRDPRGRPMLCHLVTTPDLAQATRYETGEAFELWRAVDPRQPKRPDGKPNRPFTAFTVAFDKEEGEN